MNGKLEGLKSRKRKIHTLFNRWIYIVLMMWPTMYELNQNQVQSLIWLIGGTEIINKFRSGKQKLYIHIQYSFTDTGVAWIPSKTCYYRIVQSDIDISNLMSRVWDPMRSCNNPGPWSDIKMLLYQYRKSHCGPNDRLISTMGIPIPVRWHLYIESAHMTPPVSPYIKTATEI